MNDEILARLRSIDPVHGPVIPPPIESVRARLTAPATSAAAGGRGLGSRLVPVLAVAVALAVAAVAVVTLGHRAGPRPGPGPGPAVSSRPSSHRLIDPAQTLALPRGGMPGVVQLWAGTASTTNAGVVSFDQCDPCAAPRAQRFTGWMAVTAGTATGWSIQREPFYLLDAQFAGQGIIWAAGQTPDSTIDGIWVSHDDGLNWSRVRVGATNEPGSVSATAAGVWAAVPLCGPVGCATTILHGPAAGHHLIPTPAQPLARESGEVVAAGGQTAYLSVVSAAPQKLTRPQILATHDNGRSWHAVISPCPIQTADITLAAAGAGDLWNECADQRGRTIVAVSVDGGRHWRTHRPAFPLRELHPSGATSAWAVSDRDGSVIRTTDGGVSWKPVLATRGDTSLLANSTDSAAVVEAVGRGHADHHAATTNLIVSRTTDGGASWRSVVVALPAR